MSEGFLLEKSGLCNVDVLWEVNAGVLGSVLELVGVNDE